MMNSDWYPSLQVSTNLRRIQSRHVADDDPAGTHPVLGKVGLGYVTKRKLADTPDIIMFGNSDDMFMYVMQNIIFFYNHNICVRKTRRLPDTLTAAQVYCIRFVRAQSQLTRPALISGG